jgi:hypothetical protein
MALSRFVRPVVTEQRTVQEVASFSTALHLAQVPTSTLAGRFDSFTSAQELTDAGYPARVIAAAGAFFGQNPNPGRLIIGRQGLGTAQVGTVDITTEDAGNWTYTLAGQAITYVASGDDTTTDIADGLRAQTIASGILDVANLSISAVTSDAFTITANVAGDAFTLSALTVPGSGVGTSTTTTANVAAELPSVAFAAIVTAGGEWYGTTIESRSETAIDDASAWVFSQGTDNPKLFFAQTNDDGVTQATPGNMADDLFLLGYDRTDLTWHRDSTEWADVATMAVVLAKNFDVANATTAFKELDGVTPDAGSGVVDPLSSSELENVEEHANSYTIEAGQQLRFPGKVVGGQHTDTVITRDWLKARLEEAVFGVLVGAPNGVPYTVAGIAMIEGAIRGVAQAAANAGHILPDYIVTMPTLAQLTSAIRASRNLPFAKLSGTYQGFIHTVFDIDVPLSYG